jgi:DNA-binding NarL/FixJ family response regulator
MSSPHIFLVGHCGPDTSYLRVAVKKALPDSAVHTVHDEAALDTAIAKIPAGDPPPLLLVNRALEPGFVAETGVELIAQLRGKYPDAKLLLVSNYDDAQAAAVKNGALRGFGKRDIGSPALTALLQETAK